MALRARASSLVLLCLAAACERGGATPAPSPTAPEPEPPAAAEPRAPSDVTPAPAADPTSAPADTPDPAAPAAPSPEPSPAGDTAHVERVLAEYHRIERFLRPRPEDAELSEADEKLLRTLLPGEQFDLYEGGTNPDMVRKAWLERMSQAAARGEPPSTLRMPLYTNVGWGCEVPSEWVATGNFGPDVTFILPVGETSLVERCTSCYGVEDEERRQKCIADRCALQVQGHFTGKITKPKARCHGIGHEFHIERATANGPSPTPFFLALPGGAPPPDGPPITEGPRWGVLFSTAFRHETNARERADALRARLVEKGHADAQVLDSRRIPTLWCCSFAVLVERFDDRKSAKALAKRLERQGFAAALVRELY